VQRCVLDLAVCADDVHPLVELLWVHGARDFGSGLPLLTMLSSYGGLGTAHRLLASSEVSTGFTALFERGRLDLTVEALVVKPEFAGLFTEDEVEAARDRLRQLGYL
jgi:hypothetical protein